MKTLLVGFKKYASHPTNPSEEVLSSFLGKKGIQILLLEANYEKSRKSLEKAIAKDKPSFIFIMNLSPYHSTPTLEQYAYNEMDSIQPDEGGNLKTKEEIFPGAEKSLSTPFDLSRFNQILSTREMESALSVDGGRFFDNEAYYIALKSGIPSILVHLPLESLFPVEEDARLISTIIDLAEKNIA